MAQHVVQEIPRGTLGKRVQAVLVRLQYAWRPSEAGGQEPNWSFHARFHAMTAAIAHREARAEAREFAK